MPNGYNKVNPRDYVSRGGSETIGGLKKFNTFPLTPEEDPTDDYQVVNRQYVNGSAHYYCSPGSTDITANGTWRIRNDGTDLLRERREGGVWVAKAKTTP